MPVAFLDQWYSELGYGTGGRLETGSRELHLKGTAK